MCGCCCSNQATPQPSPCTSDWAVKGSISPAIARSRAMGSRETTPSRRHMRQDQLPRRAPQGREGVRRDAERRQEAPGGATSHGGDVIDGIPAAHQQAARTFIRASKASATQVRRKMMTMYITDLTKMVCI